MTRDELAAMPAQVTEEMFLAGFDAYAKWCRKRELAPDIRPGALRQAIEAALAAAPRQPAPEPEIGCIGCSDKSAPMGTMPQNPVVDAAKNAARVAREKSVDPRWSATARDVCAALADYFEAVS